jgi:hypothetical protein
MRASKQLNTAFMPVTTSMASCTVEELKSTSSQNRMDTASNDWK